MGAYSPAPVVSPEMEERITREVLVPVVHALRVRAFGTVASFTPVS